MDFLRTLKKRKPKKHARVAAAKHRRIRIRRRGTTLNLASCLALFLGLALVTQGQAEDYFIYQTPNGGLVISNKEPPPGSKIIRQHSWPDVTDSEVSQGKQPKNPQPNGQPEGLPKPSKTK